MADLRCAGAKWNHSRQLPVVLQLILQLSKFLDDVFAFLRLLLLGHGANGSVQVVNCTSLGTLAQLLSSAGRMLTIMTGHRSLAETEAKLERSEVKYWAGRCQPCAQQRRSTSLRVFGSNSILKLFFLRL